MSFGSEIRCPSDPKWPYKRGRGKSTFSSDFSQADTDMVNLECFYFNAHDSILS